MIVEDDHMLNRVMTLQLQTAGHFVRSAKTGANALRLIEERIPSVLILDVGLPDLTGREIIDRLRQNPLTASIPLIVHTTLDLSEEEKEQLCLGPSRFVTKATAFSERLGELVAEVLDETGQ
ncbi:MAG: response regulator [Cyanobacteria bacterium REEB67]|nr:response regulator [Cyanobacteria bacterium REEB67]